MATLILMFALPVVASTIFTAGAVELLRGLPEAGLAKKNRKGRRKK